MVEMKIEMRRLRRPFGSSQNRGHVHFLRMKLFRKLRYICSRRQSTSITHILLRGIHPHARTRNLLEAPSR